jgi:hypothetical protein
VNARAVFAKYSIAPERGINFGPFVYGSKKTRVLTIKNEGEFEFRFNISKFSDSPENEESDAHSKAQEQVCTCII